jgi:hypothetical protein
VEEVPLGGGTGTGTRREAPSDSVVPGDYPQAGRDFPADPSREYVPGEQLRPEVEAAAQVGVGVGQQQRTYRDRREITEEDLVDPEELERERQREFREMWDRYQEDLREDDRPEWWGDGRSSAVSLREDDTFTEGPGEFLIEETPQNIGTDVAPRGRLEPPRILPGADTDTLARQDPGVQPAEDVTTDVGLRMEPLMATEQATGFRNQTETTLETGYPTNPGYGYGTGTGSGGGYGGPPVRIPRPEEDFDSSEFEETEDPGLFANPIAGAGIVLGGFGVPPEGGR